MTENTKKDFFSGIIAMVAIAFFLLAPAKDALGPAVQGFIIALIFFGLLPLGYHFFVQKKSWKDIAFEQGGWKRGGYFAVIVTVVFLINTIVLLAFLPSFRESLVLPTFASKSPFGLVFYELLLVPALLFLYEIFFRGFLQYTWFQKKYGFWAILLQAVVFFILLALTKNLTLSTLPLLVTAFLSGVLVWRNSSIMQAWVASWLYLFSLDMFLLFTT